MENSLQLSHVQMAAKGKRAAIAAGASLHTASTAPARLPASACHHTTRARNLLSCDARHSAGGTLAGGIENQA